MSDLHEIALELAEQKLARVKRLEVIDDTGRGYSRYFEPGEHLKYDFQDDNRTLKIFIQSDLKQYYYPGSDPQE
jgi:hypothetical protein